MELVQSLDGRQIGPFAVVPLWVIQSGASLQALRLYTWLHGRYVNQGEFQLSDEQLAVDLNVSVRTIHRALRSLRKVGAIR